MPDGPQPDPDPSRRAPLLRVAGPTLPGVRTTSVLRGPFEIVLIRVVDPSGVPVALRLDGHRITDGGAPLTCHPDHPDHPEHPDRTDRPAAWARRADGQASTLVGLQGFERSGVDLGGGGPDAPHRWALPWLATTAPPAPGQVLGALRCLTELAAGEAAADVRICLTREDDGRTLATVVWADGMEQEAFLDAAAPPR